MTNVLVYTILRFRVIESMTIKIDWNLYASIFRISPISTKNKKQRYSIIETPNPNEENDNMYFSSI